MFPPGRIGRANLLFLQPSAKAEVGAERPELARCSEIPELVSQAGIFHARYPEDILNARLQSCRASLRAWHPVGWGCPTTASAAQCLAQPGQGFPRAIGRVSRAPRRC